MIVRKNSAPIERGGDNPKDRIDTALISNAGGLKLLGIYLQTLWPDASTGEGHWHSAEDEFLYVTEGIVTVIDDDGAHDLHTGDAAVWRAGVPNAHHVINRSDAACRYIIAGTRIARDICTYPGSGRRQVNGDTTWEIIDGEGNRIKGGDLPVELLNLSADWTTPPVPGDIYCRIVREGDAEVYTGSAEQNARIAAFETHLYSDAGGLQQFAAFTKTLQPRSRCPDHHWHDVNDTFLFMLAGEATVIEGEGLHVLQAGDAACWPAGGANGPHVMNHSTASCTYLMVSTRRSTDKVQYQGFDKV